MRNETSEAKHLDPNTIEEDIDITPSAEESSKERRDSVISLVFGLVLIINFAASCMGWAPIGDPETIAQMVYTFLSGGVAIFDLVYGWWWTNHNLTNEAQAGQRVTDLLKEGGITDFMLSVFKTLSDADGE